MGISSINQLMGESPGNASNDCADFGIPEIMFYLGDTEIDTDNDGTGDLRDTDDGR